MRYLAELNYDGTNYHGWQVQPNAKTVQGVLNHVLSEISLVHVESTGCGRTDTGVHARKFYAHFDLPLVPANFVRRANILLPADIRIQKLYAVGDEFNARFDALSRSYEYSVNFKPDPFIYKYVLLLYNKPDFEAMNKAAAKLMDYITFSSFSKTGADNRTDKCKITEAAWRIHEDGVWKFHITSDRFLRGMVRAIVGTLLLVGFDKINLADFTSIIENYDRSTAGESVAAHGLALTDVVYPEEIFLKQIE